MQKFTASLFIFFLFIFQRTFAGPGDTTVVQTFTFGSPQDAWFSFPSGDKSYEKVLMLYTLKCNPAQSPACGEWDYLTYTYLLQHTGNYDSTLLYHPNFLANGASPDTFAYSTTPTYTLLPHWQYSVHYDDTLSYSEVQFGDGTDQYDHPFSAASPLSRTQILYRADELLAAGITAGNISGLQFNIASSGSAMNNLKLKMASTSLTELSESAYVNSGFYEVYAQNIFFSTAGWNDLDFENAFVWDGVSNIVAEITFDNLYAGISSLCYTSTTDFNSVVHMQSSDKYISFTQPAYATPVINSLSTLSNEVTVSFWAFGDSAAMPQNGTCFEAVDAGGERILNSHTPWSDENIYWDAGNGGYDRINKVASPSDYKNTWTHWAFTKNAATGDMKIYKNGVLFHSGTGKIKTLEDITTLYLGKGTWGGSESYEGKMDEFAIWNAELDAATIQAYLYKDLDDLHPYKDDLLLYYHFNDAAGVYQNDYSTSGAPLALIGAPVHLMQAEDQFRNIEVLHARPDVIFEQGVYTMHLDSVLVIDTVYNDPITLINFDPLHPAEGMDTTLVYPANYYVYTYDDAGAVADSTLIPATNTIYNEEYTYYSAPYEVINRFELARYITPYGIGLDLGEGFTWTYDLTDYLPLLHDSVHLNAGNWQELLDVKFLFIEGTPARTPTSVTNLWSGGFSYGLEPSYDDQTPDRTITIPADAANSRIKVRVTGHGFGGTSNCSEFCKKEHYIYVNGVQQWQQEVWRETCDLNPVYPQGGTWVYDRANWCPGAEVQTYDVELTPFVTPGTSVTLDYDAEPYTWNGAGSVPYYQTEVQLITYDAPNFSLDAAVDEIIAPGVNDMWSRKNTVCNNPVIRIKNTGETTLNSLVIEYGLKGLEQSTYTWNGELSFLESEEITLPDFAWSSSATEFQVTISQPNGGSDEYALNDHAETKITLPATFPSDFIIEMKTNNKPNENDLYLFDAAGNTVLERTDFESSTVYRDTLDLPDGCYELYLYDHGEDGLSWWANTDGTGYFKLKNVDVPTYIKTYNPDFGGLIYEQFTVGNYVDVNDLAELNSGIFLYPNPAANTVYLRLNSGVHSSTQLRILDVNGSVVKIQELPAGNSIHTIDCSSFAEGIYIVSVDTGSSHYTKTFVVSR